MSRLTRCRNALKPRAMLPLSSAVPVVMFGGALLLFGLGQLHLQFAVSDLKQETSRLQARKLELSDKLRLLGSEVESGKRGDRLLVHAKAGLGMVECPAHEQERLAMAPDIRERYSGIDVARAREAGQSIAAAPETLPEIIAARIGMSGKAVAAEPAKF